MKLNEAVELCLQAQQGNEQARERLMHMYRPLMISLARKWTACGYEDALQESHIAFLEAVDRYNAASDIYLGVFLRRRIRAHLRTWGRRERRWTARNMAASAHQTDDEGVPPVEMWADQRKSSDRWRWEEWMHGLSPRERFVIEKQFIEGYGLWEIAAREGVSRHTVQTWKKRAMKKLRKKWKQNV